MRFAVATALALSLSLTLAAAAQDFEKGVRAYERGDYAAALAEWRPLADAGEPEAQYRLGFLHAHGMGVAKSYKAACTWYLKAAHRGHLPAIYELGQLYEFGRGVIQDNARAAYWFHRGALAGHAPSREKFRHYQRHLATAERPLSSPRPGCT